MTSSSSSSFFFSRLVFFVCVCFINARAWGQKRCKKKKEQKERKKKIREKFEMTTTAKRTARTRTRTMAVVVVMMMMMMMMMMMGTFAVSAASSEGGGGGGGKELGKAFEAACASEAYEKANEVGKKLGEEVERRQRGDFYVRPRESGYVRFTHDTSETLDEEETETMQRTANTGNPGVMYARVENINVNNQNWPYFQFNRRDAMVNIMCAPPTSTKYYSYVTYVWRKTFSALGLRSLRQAVSAQASSSPVNNKNVRGSRAFRRALIIISTPSAKTFNHLKEEFEKLGIEETSIELEALRYDELNFLPSIIADDLTTSFRVGIWPLKGAEALGVFARYEWPAMIVRGRELANGGNVLLPLLLSRRQQREENDDKNDERQQRDMFYSKEHLPMRKPNDALLLLNDEDSQQKERIISQEMLDAAADDFHAKLANTFGNVKRFSLERVDVGDGAKCLSDPSFQPFSLPGVNVRSGCFGSTSDAAYSLSEKLVNNVGELSDGNIVADASALTENSQDFIIFLFGANEVNNGRATFFNVAAYTTGDPVSSRRSALFVSIVASLDDRSFDNSASSSSYYSAAFATSEEACSTIRTVSTPCAVMLERNFGNVFLIERVYLDPNTAKAPSGLTQTRAFLVKV